MKKCFLGFIATIVTVSMLFGFVGCAKETPAEYFDYHYDPDSEGIVITGFNNKADLLSVVIPKRINKHPVTCIGEKAFRFEYFKSITIPNTVIEIGNDAFYHCKSLASITIPDSVTKIGKDAFFGCESLNDVIIPNSVTEIRACTFSNCIRLSTVTIPDSVKKIGPFAFSGCISLNNVTIPDSVTEIGGSAFAGCTSLGNITIPDSVEYIDPTAFERTWCKSTRKI